MNVKKMLPYVAEKENYNPKTGQLVKKTPTMKRMPLQDITHYTKEQMDARLRQPPTIINMNKPISFLR